jgi:hypothetical protein
MTKHRRMIAGEHGWSEWVQPKHDAYKLTCCGCGLVHDMEFRVVKDGKDKTTVGIDSITKGLVIFRARRNVRSTAAIRRYRRERADQAASDHIS